MAKPVTFDKTEGKRLRKDRVIKKFYGIAIGGHRTIADTKMGDKRRALVEKMKKK